MRNRFNFNKPVFLLAAFFIVLGFHSGFLNAIKWPVIDTLVRIKYHQPADIKSMISQINKASAETLRYHDFLMDLNSCIFRR